MHLKACEMEMTKTMEEISVILKINNFLIIKKGKAI